MRSDMKYVIIEQPRRGGIDRIKRIRDLESAPIWEKMRSRSRIKDRKELSDFLNPLEGYLRKQVGRPWNEVYSELAKNLDRRTVSGLHIWQHIKDFVNTEVWIGTGRKVYESRGHNSRYRQKKLFRRHRRAYPTQTREHEKRMIEIPGEVYTQQFFRRFWVDPRDGILKRNEIPRYKYQKPDNPDRKIIDDDTQLHRIDGIWYEIKLGPDMKPGMRWDSVLHARVPCQVDVRDVLRTPKTERFLRYGRDGVVAINKRQISKREKKQYEIV